MDMHDLLLPSFYNHPPHVIFIILICLDDLCKPLNCKKKELCLLEDAFTAVCVSKKELHKNKLVK